MLTKAQFTLIIATNMVNSVVRTSIKITIFTWGLSNAVKVHGYGLHIIIVIDIALLARRRGFPEVRLIPPELRVYDAIARALKGTVYQYI